MAITKPPNLLVAVEEFIRLVRAAVKIPGTHTHAHTQTWLTGHKLYAIL